MSENASNKTPGNAEIGDIKVARKVAAVLGPSSAAAAALRRYHELVSTGYWSEIVLSHGVWLVKEAPK